MMGIAKEFARRCAVMLLGLHALSVHAGGSIETFIVTSTADTETPGTLRQAILDANGSGATDVRIDIDLADGSVILLGNDLPLLTHPAVQVRNLQPANAIAIDGDGSHRLFQQVGVDPTISVSDLEMRNGWMSASSAANGGACLYTQGRALLYSVRFSGCETVNGSGGAVHAKNNLLVETSEFDDNTVFHDGGAGYRGGAVHCSGVLCDISGSSFTGNRVLTQLSGQTDRGGGAVHSTATDFFVENSRFISNQGAGRGGAIHVTLPDSGSSAQIDGSLFRANSGGEGGAIWVAGFDDNTVVTLDRNGFDRNVASGRAPALRVDVVAQVDLSGNVFYLQESTNTSVAWGTVYIFANSTRQSLVTLDFNTFVGEDENSILFQVSEPDPNDVVVTRMHANIFDQRADGQPACKEGASQMTPQAGLFNVVSDASCTGSIEADSVVSVDPLVTASVSSRRTIVYPEPGSPAVDLVDSETLVVCSFQTDLDGTVRPLDGDDDSVAYCDAGAVERNVQLFSDRFEN